MKIPKGWRRLRDGAIIRAGDKFSYQTFVGELVPWRKSGAEGCQVGHHSISGNIYIRRRAK